MLDDETYVAELDRIVEGIRQKQGDEAAVRALGSFAGWAVTRFTQVAGREQARRELNALVDQAGAGNVTVLG